MTDLLLPAQLHQQLLEYLSDRPIREAGPLFAAVQQLKPADAPSFERHVTTGSEAGAAP